MAVSQGVHLEAQIGHVPRNRHAARSRMSPPAKRRRCSPPAELNDDVIGEIVLRLPPDDPALLVRCSLVCKSWRRLLSSDPVFLRSYRDLHRTPPLLGFLFNQLEEEDRDVACFAPTSSFRLPNPHHRGWYALDARHGLVLFSTMLSHDVEAAEAAEHELVVWDPMTGRRWRLDFPDFLDDFNWSATVLCAADGCDHRDCHGVPFLVVVASTGRYCYTSAAIYSSETGSWGDEIEHEHPDDAVRIGKPGVQVGNALYFLCIRSARILECDMGGSQTLAMFDSPVADRRWPDNGLLMTAEGGGLGFAFARRSILYLWSMEANGGAMAWTQRRSIDLDPLLAVLRIPDDRSMTPNLIGFADGVRVIFAEIDGAIFTIDLRSRRGKKVYRRSDLHMVFPNTSFYTPRGMNFDPLS